MDLKKIPFWRPALAAMTLNLLVPEILEGGHCGFLPRICQGFPKRQRN
jgi:hypothetical protein